MPEEFKIRWWLFLNLPSTVTSASSFEITCFPLSSMYQYVNLSSWAVCGISPCVSTDVTVWGGAAFWRFLLGLKIQTIIKTFQQNLFLGTPLEIRMAEMLNTNTSWGSFTKCSYLEQLIHSDRFRWDHVAIFESVIYTWRGVFCGTQVYTGI